jgi:hypothetical protein
MQMQAMSEEWCGLPWLGCTLSSQPWLSLYSEASWYQSSALQGIRALVNGVWVVTGIVKRHKPETWFEFQFLHLQGTIFTLLSLGGPCL